MGKCQNKVMPVRRGNAHNIETFFFRGVASWRDAVR